MNLMDEDQPRRLLTLRLWREDLGNGQMEWRGQLRDVISGETCYFRTLAELNRLLREMGGWRDPPER